MKVMARADFDFLGTGRLRSGEEEEEEDVLDVCDGGILDEEREKGYCGWWVDAVERR
jgi:hypothetical protein